MPVAHRRRVPGDLSGTDRLSVLSQRSGRARHARRSRRSTRGARALELGRRNLRALEHELAGSRDDRRGLAKPDLVVRTAARRIGSPSDASAEAVRGAAPGAPCADRDRGYQVGAAGAAREAGPRADFRATVTADTGHPDRGVRAGRCARLDDLGSRRRGGVGRGRRLRGAALPVDRRSLRDGGLSALESVHDRHRRLVFVDASGGLIALTAAPQADLQALRQKFGL